MFACLYNAHWRLIVVRAAMRGGSHMAWSATRFYCAARFSLDDGGADQTEAASRPADDLVRMRVRPHGTKKEKMDKSMSSIERLLLLIKMYNIQEWGLYRYGVVIPQVPDASLADGGCATSARIDQPSGQA